MGLFDAITRMRDSADNLKQLNRDGFELHRSSQDSGNILILSPSSCTLTLLERRFAATVLLPSSTWYLSLWLFGWSCGYRTEPDVANPKDVDNHPTGFDSQRMCRM